MDLSFLLVKRVFFRSKRPDSGNWFSYVIMDVFDSGSAWLLLVSFRASFLDSINFLLAGVPPVQIYGPISKTRVYVPRMFPQVSGFRQPHNLETWKPGQDFVATIFKSYKATASQL